MSAFGEEFMFTGLKADDRLFVMAQNPANYHNWSKPIGPHFTVAELKRALAILDAAEAMREALGPSGQDTSERIVPAREESK
jgi:hypothetical protein